jgi:predicted GIY-YIG superfamily endonuclease
MAYVYMLKCSDESYYVGQTTDIERRLQEHHAGTYGGYTSFRRPVRLVWFQETQTADEAFKLERKLKGWSRAKKEALIDGDYERIHQIVSEERRRREG